MNRFRYALAAAAVTVVLVTFAGLAGITMASPASGVTPTLLARGLYDDFKVKSAPHSPIDFQVKAKTPVDVIVRQHDYAVGSHTGWHSHPGPVFITVTKGTLTYYLYDDPTCTPHEVSAPNAVADVGRPVPQSRVATPPLPKLVSSLPAVSRPTVRRPVSRSSPTCRPRRAA